MEHIIQIAVGVDDNAIEKAVYAAVDKNTATRVSDVLDHYYELSRDHTYQNAHYKVIDKMIMDKIDAFLKDNEEVIIAGAIERLADRLVRRKSVKDKADKIAKEL